MKSKFKIIAGKWIRFDYTRFDNKLSSFMAIRLDAISKFGTRVSEAGQYSIEFHYNSFYHAETYGMDEMEMFKSDLALLELLILK
ncbi:MAG: hypothetical protein K9J06_10760 [Flavobacteriales bacterium]|nr:hypothetical protein [Flavobacteriales bacterium]